MDARPAWSVDMALEWLDRDPARLAAWLTGLGFTLVEDGGSTTLVLPPLSVSLLAGDARREGFRFATAARGRGGAGAVRHANGVERAVALALASTDGERTVRGLAGVGPDSGLRGVDGLLRSPADEALGARSWLAPSGRLLLLVVEPSTEGRLAAALARHGEGPAAIYLSAPTGVDECLAASLDPPRRWPGGAAARLVRPFRRWGPFLLVVERG